MRPGFGFWRARPTKGPTNKVCGGKSLARTGGKAHGAWSNTSPQTVALACDFAPFSDALKPSGNSRPGHRAAPPSGLGRVRPQPVQPRPKAGEVARSVSQSETG